MNHRSPREIIDMALGHAPVAIRVGFSGGRDSLAVTHWMMANVSGCEVVHFNTGIGIERTREYVRETCKDFGWPLTEIRAKEDCGQDYDELVKRYGFPGPSGHSMMYARLKERAVRLMCRRLQRRRGDRILLATGIRHDESMRRMRYAGREINVNGRELWTNPIYWWSASKRDSYNRTHELPVNPVSEVLGMSGECLCGAFAHKGEKDLIRIVCRDTAARIERLEEEVLACGFTWGWEGRPPKGGWTESQLSFMPLCIGCEKRG